MIVNTNFYNGIYIKYLLCNIWIIFEIILIDILTINILLNQFLSLRLMIEEIQSQNKISINNKNRRFYIKRINYRIYIG